MCALYTTSTEVAQLHFWIPVPEAIISVNLDLWFYITCVFPRVKFYPSVAARTGIVLAWYDMI